MKRDICRILLIAVGILVFCSNSFSESLKPEYELTNKLVSLVDEAIALTEKKGEQAFVEFSIQGSKWRHGETYIFVLDMDGTCVVNPDPDLVGENLINLKDMNGKPIIRSILKKVSGKNKAGWTHYFWPKPQGIFPTWKTVYAKRARTPSGDEYIFCCGLYNMKMERMFVAEIVNEAIELMEREGKMAFNTFRSKSSDFYFLNTYLFVINDQGYCLVEPSFPFLEGRNLYSFKDEKGKHVISEMISAAKTTGCGWVDYMWPKPGGNIPVKKRAFVKGMKLNKELIIVGSGIYLD